MTDEVDLPSSTVLMLLRIDRRELAVSARSLGISVSHARRRFSGVGLPWYSLRAEGIQLRVNGVIALVDGMHAHKIGDPPSDVWAELIGKWPLIARARWQVLAQIELTNAKLDALEYYAGAIELLDRLMTFVLSRPGATAREIAACERWLHGRFTQYLTGRGALRNVVLPWRSWLERYEYILRSLEGELAELELPPEGPLAELSCGLKLITTSRDRKTVIHEYRTRLGDLTDACNRVAAEIGVLGTFGSLALVPFESTLGFLFLGPVVFAGLAYYGGHSLARATVLRWRWRRAALVPGSQSHIDPSARPDRPTLANILRRLVKYPVHIFVGSRLSAADVACALEIRHQLLEQTTCVDPLQAITIGPRDTNNKEMKVVLGGPLVRAILEPFVTLECDLTDFRGNGWEIIAGGRPIVHCDDDETVGICAVGLDARTLFVFGVRDSGTVIATRWLAQALGNAETGHGANWVALRRDNNRQPEEFARG